MPNENSFPSLDQLAPNIPPVTWLWPGWIPRGMITLLCAAPGAGKSYFALDLARRLIAGLPWPDGAESTRCARRSSAQRHLRRRRSRAPAPQRPRRRLGHGSQPSLPHARRARRRQARRDASLLDLNSPACQDRLLKMAAALRPALIIVDSLGSAAHGAENQVAAVDALFDYLNSLAALLSMRAARHPSPPQDAGPLAAPGPVLPRRRRRARLRPHRLPRPLRPRPDRSQGWPAVQIGLEPRPHAPRRLQLLKTNLGPVPDSARHHLRALRPSAAARPVLRPSAGPGPPAHTGRILRPLAARDSG